MEETQQNSISQPSPFFKRIKLAIRLSRGVLATYARHWNNKLGFTVKSMNIRIPFVHIVNETVTGLLPLAFGMLIYKDVVHGNRMGAFYWGFLSGGLLITTVARNLMEQARRRSLSSLFERQLLLAKMILSENERLIHVAIDAERVKAMIEAGYDPDLAQLTRSLTALHPETSARVN